MATRKKFTYDDRTFYVETFEAGGNWKGRFILHGCFHAAEQERVFDVDGAFSSEQEAMDAARRAAIEFAA